MSYFLFNIIRKLVKTFNHALRYLYSTLFGQKQKFTLMRYVLSYLIGISIAVVFWKFCIRNLQFPLDVTYGSLIVLLIILGLGFVFTTAIKCIAFLACMELMGKTGRGFLRALCVAYIISGPISNLALNGQETVRVFACTTILSYNLTKTRFDLMTKPFQNTLSDMKDEIKDVRKIFENIVDVLQPIKDEIEGEFDKNNSSEVNPIDIRFIRQNILSSLSFSDATNETEKISEAKKIREKYSNKMRLRCKEQLEKGEKRCINAFSNAHDKCMDKLPAILNLLLCWPLRIDYVCDMKLLGYQETGGICDPDNAIDPKLGDNILMLKEIENNLFRNSSDVNVTFEVVDIKAPLQLRSAKDTAELVMKEFDEKKRVFDYIMTIMQRVLSFIFLKVIYSSITYHKNYLTRIDFDNIYITPYFKKIDNRRKERNQHSLLPLKKFQQKHLIDTSKPCDRTKKESQVTTFLFLQLILEILISGFFLLLDHMIVVLLKIVATKSEITYFQEGEHIISFHINGTGLMARLMRKTLHNFNIHERVSTFLSNESCLPKPSILSQGFYMTLLGLYIMTLVLIYVSSLTLRTRMFICSFFYRKREKQRTLHLYNKMLKQRKSLFEMMYQKVRKDLEAKRLRMKLNLFLWLRLGDPRFWGWLRFLHLARRKCLICNEPEPKNPENLSAIKFIECKTQSCNFIYCEECWLDIGQICLACQSKENVIKCCSFKGRL